MSIKFGPTTVVNDGKCLTCGGQKFIGKVHRCGEAADPSEPLVPAGLVQMAGAAMAGVAIDGPCPSNE